MAAREPRASGDRSAVTASPSVKLAERPTAWSSGRDGNSQPMRPSGLAPSQVPLTESVELGGLTTSPGDRDEHEAHLLATSPPPVDRPPRHTAEPSVRDHPPGFARPRCTGLDPRHAHGAGSTSRTSGARAAGTTVRRRL